MRSLPKRILEYAESLPEATPLCPAGLLHLDNRAAVDQALSRLARSDKLMRIFQGVYMLPKQTRFGVCSPCIDKALQSLAALWGETIVPTGLGRQLPGIDHAESGALRLSHFRSQPPVEF